MNRHAPGRIDAIEHLKGLAILLVVAAHLVKHQTLDSAPWYELFKHKVYLFHMPLFMFASGYVYFHRGAHRIPLAGLAQYAGRRADRLLVPFFALALLALAGKLLLAQVVYVDEAPPTLAQALASAFMHTEASPVQTIWYLFVLCVFCLVTPLLYRVAGRRLLLLAVFAACLYPLAPPDVLFADRLTAFFIFFVAGGVARSRQFLARLPGPRCSALLGAAFALSLALPLQRDAGLLACGLAAALAVPALLQWAPRTVLAGLHFCGRHSMAIYLFNVIAIGAAKALFLHLVDYDAALFIPLLLVTFCAGLAGPLLVEWAAGRSPRTAFLYRYIR